MENEYEKHGRKHQKNSIEEHLFRCSITSMIGKHGKGGEPFKTHFCPFVSMSMMPGCLPFEYHSSSVWIRFNSFILNVNENWSMKMKMPWKDDGWWGGRWFHYLLTKRSRSIFCICLCFLAISACPSTTPIRAYLLHLYNFIDYPFGKITIG